MQSIKYVIMLGMGSILMGLFALKNDALHITIFVLATILTIFSLVMLIKIERKEKKK